MKLETDLLLRVANLISDGTGMIYTIKRLSDNRVNIQSEDHTIALRSVGVGDKYFCDIKYYMPYDIDGTFLEEKFYNPPLLLSSTRVNMARKNLEYMIANAYLNKVNSNHISDLNRVRLYLIEMGKREQLEADTGAKLEGLGLIKHGRNSSEFKTKGGKVGIRVGNGTLHNLTIDSVSFKQFEAILKIVNG